MCFLHKNETQNSVSSFKGHCNRALQNVINVLSFLCLESSRIVCILIIVGIFLSLVVSSDSIKSGKEYGHITGNISRVLDEEHGRRIKRVPFLCRSLSFCSLAFLWILFLLAAFSHICLANTLSLSKFFKTVYKNS